MFSNFVVQMAFVGSGATGNTSTGGFNPDTLTPPVLEHKSSFNSISHTWDHTLLDNATAALTDTELLKNNAEAVTLGLPDYSPANLATPAITGLNNAAFINEAVKDGLKYLVSDASVFFSRNKYQFRQTDHQDSKACIEHNGRSSRRRLSWQPCTSCK